MYFYSVSGGNKIGGSSYFLEIEGKKFLLDMGIDPNLKECYPRYENLYKEKLITTFGDLDSIFISHAHLDHIGSLPYILKEGAFVPVYASLETKVLGEAIMLSAPKEIDEKLNYYKREEVILSTSLIQNKEVIEGDGFFAKLHNSNHILGSKMVEISVKGKKVLYTGDFKVKESITTKRIDFSEINDVDVLLCEGTNLNRKSNFINERLAFVRHVNRTIQKGGSVLIPAFALGRTQEVVSLLINGMKNSILQNVPIYIDGLSVEITELYRELGVPINSPYLQDARHGMYRKKDNTPKIVVASSGMLLEKSASYNYAKEMISNPLNSITFVGYQSKNTPGFKLLHSGSSENKATVNSFNLSAHGDESEIFTLIERINPKKVVFLHRNLNNNDEIELKKRLKDYFGKSIKFYFAEDGEGIEL